MSVWLSWFLFKFEKEKKKEFLSDSAFLDKEEENKTQNFVKLKLL